uniref:Uncharacterized LOC103173556 n=1 Tax=Callorhinchus milii TaxID=7868 RepID=A0A4W3GJQ2_CALMI
RRRRRRVGFTAPSIADPLQKPIISLRPETRAFAKGEGADIKCSGNYPGSRFDLYRDGDLISSQAAPARSGAATFALAEIAAGKYWCTYTKRLGGRAFTSPESERVGIAVWDALEKPTISLTPDTRSVARGESTAIVCSGNYPGGNFSLYRDGEFIASQPAREDNNTATFTTRSEEVGAGTYWCTYTKRIGGREFASPESERVGSSEDESWTRYAHCRTGLGDCHDGGHHLVRTRLLYVQER